MNTSLASIKDINQTDFLCLNPLPERPFVVLPFSCVGKRVACQLRGVFILEV